jgi:hypothetical protein
MSAFARRLAAIEDNLPPDADPRAAAVEKWFRDEGLDPESLTDHEFDALEHAARNWPTHTPITGAALRDAIGR